MRILLALMLLLCVASCAKSQSRVEGNKLILPSGARLANSGGAEGYVRFDGIYPAGWPQGFLFPPDSFLAKGGKLSSTQPENSEGLTPGSRIFKFSGMVKMNSAQTIEYFREQFKVANISLDKDEDAGASAQSPGIHDLSSRSDPGSPVQYMLVKVHLDKDLGGYTSFGGYALVH